MSNYCNKRFLCTITFVLSFSIVLFIFHIISLTFQNIKQGDEINKQNTTIKSQNEKIEKQEKTIDELQKSIQKLKDENTKILKLKTTVKYDVFNRVSNIIEQHNKTNKPIDKSLLLAIIKVESNFNPNAKNKSGASGLCQFMPSTYKGIVSKYKLEDKGIFNIESNTLAGIYYVKDLLEKHNNNIDSVLISYLGTHNSRYISMIKNYRQRL